MPIQPDVKSEDFQDDNPLNHPDSDNQNRYILGTRFQTKGGHRGHTRDTCAYHDLDLCVQGEHIKSMTQEGMQLVRKFRSIQQDRLRSCETSYLANFIGVLFTCFISFVVSLVPSSKSHLSVWLIN